MWLIVIYNIVMNNEWVLINKYMTSTSYYSAMFSFWKVYEFSFGYGE